MSMLETINRDGLFAGDYDIASVTVTVASGQNLARGAVVGIITTGGKATLSLSASSDGSQTPYGILAYAVDASAADQTAQVYVSGEFDGAKLVYGTGHTAATVEAAFRAKAAPLYIRSRL